MTTPPAMPSGFCRHKLPKKSANWPRASFIAHPRVQPGVEQVDLGPTPVNHASHARHTPCPGRGWADRPSCYCASLGCTPAVGYYRAIGRRLIALLAGDSICKRWATLVSGVWMRRRSAGCGCAPRGMGAPWKKRPEGSSGRRSQHRSVSVTWQCSCSGRLTEWISNYPNGNHTNPCAWRHDSDRHQRGVGVDAARSGARGGAMDEPSAIIAPACRRSGCVPASPVRRATEPAPRV